MTGTDTTQPFIYHRSQDTTGPHFGYDGVPEFTACTVGALSVRLSEGFLVLMAVCSVRSSCVLYLVVVSMVVLSQAILCPVVREWMAEEDWHMPIESSQYYIISCQSSLYFLPLYYKLFYLIMENNDYYIIKIG